MYHYRYKDESHLDSVIIDHLNWNWSDWKLLNAMVKFQKWNLRRVEILALIKLKATTVTSHVTLHVINSFFAYMTPLVFWFWCWCNCCEFVIIKTARIATVAITEILAWLTEWTCSRFLALKIIKYESYCMTWLISEKFQKFPLLSLNCHFWGKIRKMINRVNSWIQRIKTFIWLLDLP